MRTTLSTFVFAVCFFISSCDKGKTDPPQPPIKKAYLRKIINETFISPSIQTYNLLEYDGSDRLSKISSAQVGSPALLHMEFFYNSQDRLVETREYGNANGPDVLTEIRKYYHDAAGNCVGDTAFDENMYKTHYWDNSYTYDAQGRLLSRTHANGNIFRFEYGPGKNPIKAYMHYSGKPELQWILFDKFDDKKNWRGEASKVLQMYYRVFGHRYAHYLFENNPVEYRETLSTINGTTIYEIGDMKEEFQYNANGLPTRRKVIQITSSGTNTLFEQQFEYDEK